MSDFKTIRMGSVCPRCRREPARADSLCEVHRLYAVHPTELEKIGRAPLLGQVIEGRYALIGHIGAGGMGAVYRAWQLGIEREVALKILHQSAATGDVARARFRREAQVIAGLQSDHTVRVYDFGEVERGPLAGTLYMVMDLVKGFSLAERLRSGPLLVEEVGLVLAHVANSVDEAHALGIVHRDLKPSNILLTEHQGQRRVKVIDFGIARVENSDHTHAGKTLGTPAYMAPELWPSEEPLPITGRVDVYAMGVVLHQLLTGHKPFKGTDLYALAIAHCTQAPPAMASPDDPLSAFDPVVARAMAKDPDERHATIGEMAADFERHRALVEELYGPTDSFTWTQPITPPAAAEPSASSQILRGAIEPAHVEEPSPPARSGTRLWPLLALTAVGVSIGLSIVVQSRPPTPSSVVASGLAAQGAAPPSGSSAEAHVRDAGLTDAAPTAGAALPADMALPPDAAQHPDAAPPPPARPPRADRVAERPAPPQSAPSKPGRGDTGGEARREERRPSPPQQARTPVAAPPPSPLEQQIERALTSCQCAEAKSLVARAAEPSAGISDQKVLGYRRRANRCHRVGLGETCRGF